MIKETLYKVGIKHKRTGERLHVEVWGESNDQATNKLLNSLIGIDKPYAWTGTGPVEIDNHIIQREVEP